MLDLKLIETYDGGDFEILGSDLASTVGLEGMIYLALFGGDDWWGNDLLLDQDESAPFNATTEKVMRSVALNSAGALKIENAIKYDLAFLTKKIPGTDISVETEIVSQDRVDIYIKINGNLLYIQVSFAATTMGKDMIVQFGVFSKEFTEQFT